MLALHLERRTCARCFVTEDERDEFCSSKQLIIAEATLVSRRSRLDRNESVQAFVIADDSADHSATAAHLASRAHDEDHVDWVGIGHGGSPSD